MAESLRIRGQEVQLRITRNAVLERTITAIVSCEVMFKFDIQSQGYLGETTDRRDDYYRGIEGNIVFNPESQEPLEIITLIRERASRRVPQTDAVINLVAKLNFPNGQKPTISIQDLKFGDFPLSISGREAYVSQTFTWAADDFTLATT